MTARPLVLLNGSTDAAPLIASGSNTPLLIRPSPAVTPLMSLMYDVGLNELAPIRWRVAPQPLAEAAAVAESASWVRPASVLPSPISLSPAAIMSLSPPITFMMVDGLKPWSRYFAILVAMLKEETASSASPARETSSADSPMVLPAPQEMTAIRSMPTSTQVPWPSRAEMVSQTSPITPVIIASAPKTAASGARNGTKLQISASSPNTADSAPMTWPTSAMASATSCQKPCGSRRPSLLISDSMALAAALAMLSRKLMAASIWLVAWSTAVSSLCLRPRSRITVGSVEVAICSAVGPPGPMVSVPGGTVSSGLAGLVPLLDLAAAAEACCSAVAIWL